MIAGQPLASVITIGVITKNRWADLELTLTEFSKFGLDACKIIIHDDGSETPAPPSILSACPTIEYSRSESSHGVAHARNHVASLIETPLWLHLDDDSYIVTGDLLEAATYLLSKDHLAGLALNLKTPRRPQQVPLDTTPYEVQRFIGCAVLLKLEHFRKARGYDMTMKYCEHEGDLSAKMLKRGGCLELYPSILVFHRISPRNRDYSERAYWIARNRLILVWSHTPLPQLLIKVATSLPGSVALFPSDFYLLACFKGFFSGLKHILKDKLKRNPMTQEQYHKWRRLPWAPHE